MGTNLHNLTPPPGARKKKKRVGRGPGSGGGKTAGRGQKGQRARSKVGPGFEGGQIPIQRRVPKRGFENRNRIEVCEVNVKRLECWPDGTEVTPAALIELGLVPKKAISRPIKVLGDGELTKKLDVYVHRISVAARAKIERAGGTVVLLKELRSSSYKKLNYEDWAASDTSFAADRVHTYGARAQARVTGPVRDRALRLVVERLSHLLWTEHKIAEKPDLNSISLSLVHLVEHGAIPEFPSSLLGYLARWDSESLLRKVLLGSAKNLTLLLRNETQLRIGSPVWEIAMTRLAQLDENALIDTPYIKKSLTNLNSIKPISGPGETPEEALPLIVTKYKATLCLLENERYEEAFDLIINTRRHFAEHRDQLPHELYAQINHLLGYAASCVTGSWLVISQAYEAALRIWQKECSAENVPSMVECHLGLANAYAHEGRRLYDEERAAEFGAIARRHLADAEKLIPQMHAPEAAEWSRTLQVFRDKVREASR